VFNPQVLLKLKSSLLHSKDFGTCTWSLESDKFLSDNSRVIPELHIFIVTFTTTRSDIPLEWYKRVFLTPEWSSWEPLEGHTDETVSDIFNLSWI
jgi:hypothetical protein